jgi:uncharacterized membrane protein
VRGHTATIEIARAPDDVFAYLADLRHDPEWRHDVGSSELVSGTAGAAPSRYRQTATDKKATAYHVDVTDVDRSSQTVRFATVDASPVAVRGGYRVAGSDSQTTVTLDVELHPSGAVRLFEPFMGPSLRKTASRYLADLKTQLETGR